MIICEKAVETVNLYVSVIKFLRFEGIIWQGDSLPLQIAPLGELFQVSVDLKARGETKQPEAWWAQHYLYGDFVHGKVYDVSLRVEFGLPVATHQFQADFASIHPKQYAFTLDFPAVHTMGSELTCQLGELRHHCPIDDNWSRDILDAHRLFMKRERDYCSVTITADSDGPYAHRHFPIYRFS